MTPRPAHPKSISSRTNAILENLLEMRLNKLCNDVQQKSDDRREEIDAEFDSLAEYAQWVRMQCEEDARYVDKASTLP